MKVKSCTDLEQSKILAKILPIESADMRYDEYISHIDGTPKVGYKKGVTNGIPCWSLSALLNAVDFITMNLHYDNARTDWVASATIRDSAKHCTKYESTRALNPVDVCVEMIIKLKNEGIIV